MRQIFHGRVGKFKGPDLRIPARRITMMYFARSVTDGLLLAARLLRVNRDRVGQRQVRTWSAMPLNAEVSYPNAML